MIKVGNSILAIIAAGIAVNIYSHNAVFATLCWDRCPSWKDVTTYKVTK